MTARDEQGRYASLSARFEATVSNGIAAEVGPATKTPPVIEEPHRMAWLGSQQAREEREPWSGGELVVDELASARARGGPDVSGGSAYPEVRQDPDAAFRDAMEAQCGGWRTLVTRTSG